MKMLVRLAFVPLVLAAAAGVAAGDGGPAPGAVTGWDGVVGPNGKTRYVALWAGPKTVVAAVRVNGGRVLRSSVVDGSYGIPLVAYDGSAGGVSTDGKTLVLSTFTRPPSPGSTTSFAVVNPASLKVRRVVELDGSWSYDAISPDGSVLYLVQYLSGGNVVRYRVRSYDLEAGRLHAGAIVDKREPGPMQGLPVTRATSGDGAWAYTLYAKTGGHHHFVHALNTTRRIAVCIDLPWHSGQEAMMSVRMAMEGPRTLVLSQPGVGRLATVDTTTFRVRSFRAPVAPGT